MHIVNRDKILRVAVLIDMPNMHDGLKRANLTLRVGEFNRAIAKLIYSDSQYANCADVNLCVRRLYYDYHSDHEKSVRHVKFSRFTHGFRMYKYEVIPVEKFKYSDKSLQDQQYLIGDNAKQYKSRTDGKIISDATKILLTEKLDIMVIFSGDSDLEVLSETANEVGTNLVFVAHNKMTASVLRQAGRVVALDTLDCFYQSHHGFNPTGTEA